MIPGMRMPLCRSQYQNPKMRGAVVMWPVTASHIQRSRPQQKVTGTRSAPRGRALYTQAVQPSYSRARLSRSVASLMTALTCRYRDITGLFHIVLPTGVWIQQTTHQPSNSGSPFIHICRTDRWSTGMLAGITTSYRSGERWR